MYMHTLRQLLRTLTLLMLLAAPLACGDGSAGEAQAGVERFIQALYDGDDAALRATAPAIAEKGTQVKDRLYETVQKYPEWQLEELSVHNGSADARVRFSREGESLLMKLSLQKGEQGWIISEKIGFSASIDFVPLKEE
jgi:hypothetical protein